MEMDFMRLREAKHIWIYGAGVVGKRVWKLLSPEAFHLPIEGMVVSAKRSLSLRCRFRFSRKWLIRCCQKDMAITYYGTEHLLRKDGI